MKNILIIKCGETFPEIKKLQGDYEDWIIKQSNLPLNVFKIFDISEGEQLRHPSEYMAAIITGSHTNINQRLAWIKQLKDWIIAARYSNIPVLGISFGHQIIAEALGGKAKQNLSGTVFGIINISPTITGLCDPLFKNIKGTFESYAFHSFEVTKLPLGAKLLATSGQNNIEAFKVDKIYGIQFHPDFNAEIMKTYTSITAKDSKTKKRAKLKLEFKNQSIIPNFLDLSLIF